MVVGTVIQVIIVNQISAADMKIVASSSSSTGYDIIS